MLALDEKGRQSDVALRPTPTVTVTRAAPVLLVHGRPGPGAASVGDLEPGLEFRTLCPWLVRLPECSFLQPGSTQL